MVTAPLMATALQFFFVSNVQLFKFLDKQVEKFV